MNGTKGAGDPHPSSGHVSSQLSDPEPSGSPKEADRLSPSPTGPHHEAVPPGERQGLKESKETMQECVSEFISFVTGEAFDKCQREKRKTVNGDDLLWP
ncbi:hypothetical protein HPP92_012668 [Vanilla planifolia]|uniref:Transcription factor CBF/NF-Y/archaeal histone domain-containing protein n=1 Tax=Vanilla planifolia TaxID=51239 RepID=A0A835QSK5_VANPL|nr:hypothetical protein HPP92_012668 [Vanilla planifolia]